MEEFVSPSFTHDKLVNPTFGDLVDVFEDSWRNCIFVPCEMLLRFPHGDVAAMTVLSTYFEAIWIHISGQSSVGRSKRFFINGFRRVFNASAPGFDKAAEAIYEQIRCGLAHEGSLRRKVNYSRVGAKAFFLSYPTKPNGDLDFDAPVASIVLNPFRVYIAVKSHFESYIRDLRTTQDLEIKSAFQKTCERLWGIGASDNIVAITEAEFRGMA